jgi:hypothetical protein
MNVMNALSLPPSLPFTTFIPFIASLPFTTFIEREVEKRWKRV